MNKQMSPMTREATEDMFTASTQALLPYAIGKNYDSGLPSGQAWSLGGDEYNNLLRRTIEEKLTAYSAPLHWSESYRHEGSRHFSLTATLGEKTVSLIINFEHEQHRAGTPWQLFVDEKFAKDGINRVRTSLELPTDGEIEVGRVRYRNTFDPISQREERWWNRRAERGIREAIFDYTQETLGEVVANTPAEQLRFLEEHGLTYLLEENSVRKLGSLTTMIGLDWHGIKF